jgi:hypothetical protein
VLDPEARCKRPVVDARNKADFRRFLASEMPAPDLARPLLWKPDVMNNGIENELQERSSGTMSSRKKVSLVASVVLSGIVALGSFGATASASPRISDVRAQTVLNAGSPRLVVAGPARLLHVDFEGSRSVSLFSVDSRNGGPDACRTGAPTAKRLLHSNVRNALDLDVASGQTVCLVADGSSVQVAWHAQQAAPSVGGTAGTQPLYASNRR